jgi:hypothetical protein
MQDTENIYLCQVEKEVSCGACCGLYNTADASRAGLCRLLEKRTMDFQKVPRDMDCLLEFGQRQSSLPEIINRPMPEFHHCPYLGFIGSDQARVGCLLHPLGQGNNGIDLRGLSYYGSMTCAMYFCPTHHRLEDDFKKIVRAVADDWYLYGLLLQDAVLLMALQAEIKKRIPSGIILLKKALSPPVYPLWKQLFSLKLAWPYASKKCLPGNYFFNDNLYPKADVDYSKTSKSSSYYDIIFRQLDSVFYSQKDLSNAEQILGSLFEDIANALNQGED